ncbi:protein IWS1 homolog isoform X2 [Sitodiplosis mosellana]|uniref:protein IWS1 homolog isoform X2 n=1 Tax=Sitodiplosis mosellana TaxID=263140 RepID=UPI00244399EC|nr:protein IWS1 homolog isoform X2 [Sitodiplosis mosellana]
MDDENDAQLDVVFKNCKNNFQLFLSTIAEYLGRKPDFSTCDLTHVSQLFANAANTSKTRNNDNATVANGTSTGAGNGTSVEVSKSVQITDDDSRDMFETENDDDDEIIPETQFFQEESNDSGESVTIPLYVEVAGNNGRFRGSSEASEGADDSEFARVRPETEADDHTEQQSQMLMANMDQSILRDIETTYTEAIANNNSNVIVSTQTVASANEASSENNDTQIDDEPNDGGRVDRSTSTTPDIELSDHVCKNLADLASMTNSNAVEKQPTAEQRENVDSDDDDINETQMFSQNIYDANTQQLANRTHSPEPQSTQDLFLAATELVFKLPAAVITPLVKTKPNPPIESQDVFDAPTHRMRSPKRLGEHVRGAAKQTSHEDSIYDAATQRAPQKEDIHDADDFFGAATQIAPPRNPRGTSEPIEPEEDDVYIAETQLPPEDYVFDQPTQQMPSDKPSSSSKKTVTWKKPNEFEPQKSNQHNVSDDLFDVGTQAFEAPEPSNNASEDLIETEFFDMPTQVVGMPSQNIPKQRLPAVLTQSSQPSLTPEWSMAARISNAAIDQFEKEQADREAEKKREKLRKNRYLFAASEDEDENEDDFDFDLALPSNPVERMSSLKESQKHGKNHDSLTRPLSASSTTTSDDSDSVPKKSNPVERVSSLKESQRQELLTRPLSVKRTKTSDDSDSVPKKSKPDANKSGKITQRDMDVKVKVSRQTVDEYLRKERQEQQNHSKKSSAPHETNKNSNATETKSVADQAPVQQRNLRRRKSEAETPPPNESRNKRKANANEDAQPKEKRGKKEPRELAALMRHSPPMAKTSASSKSKENESRLRNAKKDKDKDKAKENNISPAPMTRRLRSRTISFSG